MKVKNKDKIARKKNVALAITTVGVAALSLLMIPGTIIQSAFAHAHAVLNVTAEQLSGKKVSVIIGHTDEPAYGALPGIDTGRHNLEVLLSDDATKLPLTGANLTVDKYYFKDLNSFDRANSPISAAD